MPGKIKVKVLAGRNLPVMDRASDTTDAFVEIKFGSVTHKTDVCRKSLNPHWSSTEWYRFEVDESELQDEPLQLRLMDHDTYSANDAIGKVVISLAPLLAREANHDKNAAGPSSGAVLSGWIPVFDTMHGIRGELNVIVKVELFTDFNKYKTSSCGVQFFHCPTIPPGYKATAIHGFVEELVVNDDPEYQWIDKIRTPRASNEARQVAFIKLSNQVQRLVGVKAAELGANAVVGYQQDFDLEGEAGVVARAIGTAVSIIPPPSASQSISIPPCTQQQLRKYLDILATDNESITDLNQYFQSHQDELYKLLNILNPKTPALLDEPDAVEEDEKSILTRQSSVKSYTGSLSIYQDDYVSQKSLKHISEDQTDLNKLLKRKDDSDSDSTGPLQKIKKIKSNFFSKRFGNVRSRKSDKQDDTISLQSNSSDTSRISLSDIKSEFKKFKRLKKPKFRKAYANKQDEGIGMASILARSVIHAHTSLACIAETQDSEHSPSSTMRRTSESEPKINVSDEENSKHVPSENSAELKLQTEHRQKIPEIHTSLKNVSSSDLEIMTPRRKLSESCPATPMVDRNENLLKPGNISYYGSLSLSGDSSEVYSSSEEDDESSSQKTDTEKTVETTSSVVHSVLNNGVNPEFIAQMDRKLSILEGVVPILKESKSHGDLKEHDILFKDLESTKSSPCINEDKKETLSTENISRDTSNTTIARDTIFAPSKASSHKFKFHNPFTHKKVSKSISEPSSPVQNKGIIYRSSKKIREKISKLSNSNMIKSLSHYSLIPKKRHSDPKVTLSQPGSSTDVPSKIPSHETVLGSPFLSYADLISLDKESQDSQKQYPFKNEDHGYSKVTMYIGSEPVSRGSLSGPSLKFDAHESDHYYKSFRKDKSALKSTGLVHTAMETILIDKVQSLLVPSSPDPNTSKEKQFFDDIHHKLEKVEEAQNKFEQNNTKTSLHASLKSSEENLRSEGLVHTAIETILMDKVQSLLHPRTPDKTYGKDHKFNLTTDVHSTKSSSLNNISETQMTDDHAVIYGRERSRYKEKKYDSLLQTAMKTILIEKVQSLIPATPDVINFENNQNPLDALSKQKNHAESSNSRKSSSSHHHHHHDSLLQTAMETILIDKVQSLISPLSEPVTPTEPIVPENQLKSKNVKEKDKSSTENLTAIETNLFGKAETLLPSNRKPFVNNDDDIFEPGFHKDTLEKKDENKKLSHSTLENVAIGENSKLEIKDDEHSIYKTALHIGPLDNSLSVTEAAVKLSCIKTDDLNERENPKAECFSTIYMESRDGFEQNDKELQLENAGKTDRKEKKLVRQDSVHSLQEIKNESQKMFKDISANVAIPCISHKKPFLQHFHPILSGSPLETIPSLPESSLDHTESLDVEGVERTCICQPECQCHLCDSETNSASVCDNSHAACRFDRNEGETEKCDKEKGSPRNLHARHESYGGREPVLSSQPLQNSSLNSTSAPLGIHRRSSDSDLSVTPKGGSLNASVGNTGSGGGAILRPSMNTNNLEMLEYPFLTLTEYPPGFIVHIGGTVCARSVKLVDAGGESAARAAWWAELRTELRAHARALRCNAVIAYTETAAICEDVCVLSASGTAAVINLECDFTNEFDTLSRVGSGSKLAVDEPEQDVCSVAHVPYSLGSGPYRAELSTCGGCRKARVPAVLLATCAKPSKLLSYAKAVTITAVAARVRRAPPGSEPGARDISDQLPFLEYELHKLLLAKLRMQGANALFCLQTQIAVGERCVMALASGTAVRIATLPPPTPPRIKASENDKDALDIQKALWDSFTANKTANGYDIAGSAEQISNGALPDLELEDAPPALDLCSDKDACVLELDEAEDIETARSLATRRMHMQVFTNTLKPAPLSPPYAFAQVWRARLVLSSQGGGASTAAERHVARALDGVTYKLRRLQPCALVAPRFQLELPEDEIQLILSGAVIPLLDPNKPEHNIPELSQSPSVSPLPPQMGNGNHGNGTGDADDDIFTLDEEQLVKPAPPSEVGDDNKNVVANGPIPATVSLTSLSYVNGSKAARRICALRLLFVRETTAVRELGGLSGFLHTFTCEVMAIVRAYTSALGGNALTSFYITQLMLQDNAHKNQGQCLMSVGGDVVHVTY